MEKFWQKEWHNIKFEEFYKLNSSKIANADFYEKFYNIFFLKYETYGSLDEKWIESKECIGDFISFDICKKTNNAYGIRILSIGSGIGIIEKKLYENELHNIYIQELSCIPLKWISKILPPQNMLVGEVPDCLKQEKFDLIYMCAVDYAMNNKELLNMLKTLKEYLNKNGKFLILSASFMNHYTLLNRVIKRIKMIINILFDKFKIRPLGQFWGYMRSKSDYNKIMNGAGFKDISEGTICNGTYYIHGKNAV